MTSYATRMFTTEPQNENAQDRLFSSVSMRLRYFCPPSVDAAIGQPFHGIESPHPSWRANL